MDSPQRIENRGGVASAARVQFRALYDLKDRVSSEFDVAGIELTPEQGVILANLPQGRPFSAGESFMFGTNGTYNLRKLVELGFVVEISAKSHDRRKTMLEITKLGIAMAARIEQALRPAIVTTASAGESAA